MIPRSFESIERGDLETLITNQVAERRTLEFKRDLPGGSERERKEFLADVSSFANAQGGDILFGIDARQGVAVGLAGLAVDDSDKEMLRWEDVLLAGVEPRMPGVRFRWIDCGDKRGVMLIRVPASSIAPHRVIFARSNRFYGRKSNGKYEMDTHELRDAFTASEALPTRLRTLHVEAVDRAGLATPSWRCRDRSLYAFPTSERERSTRRLPRFSPREIDHRHLHGAPLSSVLSLRKAL